MRLIPKELGCRMKTNKNWEFSILLLFLILAVTFMLPTSARAQGIAIEGTVGKGEVLDQSLILYGQDVVMDGVIHGDLITVGKNVTINGEVDGSLVIIGQNVSLNGPVTGSSYVGALNCKLGPQANIGRDLYFIGTSLETQVGSTINRDLKAISLDAKLSGTVTGEVNALVGPVNLIQAAYNFMLDKGWLSQPFKLNFPWFQRGFEKQVAPGTAFGLVFIQNYLGISPASARGPALSVDQGLQSPRQAGAIDIARIQSWAGPMLRNLAALLILGLLVLWLLPAQLSFAGEQARIKPWRTLLTGLLVFVIGWFAALLALLLILALAFFLYWVSLPTLGFFVGALGLTSLGLVLSLFWLSIAYFSKIIIAFLCGSLLFKRFLPKYAHYRILPFLTGVILYALLASIPYLGWLIAVIVTFLGLGAIWTLSTSRKQLKEQSVEPPQPVIDEPDTSVIAEG
jgi:type IV secretory pathway VirB2 component (pilin)